MTLTGTGFTGATEVKFGSVNATSFTVNSDTSITAIVPPGVAGFTEVSVATPEATSLVASADEYRYVSPPVV